MLFVIKHHRNVRINEGVICMSTSGKKKRRTFYEPELEEVVSWMDAQGNLGQSLSVVISEAILKYGAGDIVEAFLHERLVDSNRAITSRSSRKTKKNKMTAIVDNDKLSEENTSVDNVEVIGVDARDQNDMVKSINVLDSRSDVDDKNNVSDVIEKNSTNIESNVNVVCETSTAVKSILQSIPQRDSQQLSDASSMNTSHVDDEMFEQQMLEQELVGNDSDDVVEDDDVLSIMFGDIGSKKR